MDKSTIENMQAKGFTYLGCIEGKEVFCNLESDDSIKKCTEYLESITGDVWSSGIEIGINGKPVVYVYDCEIYGIYRYGKLKYRISEGKVILPLHKCHCDYLFSGFMLPYNFELVSASEYLTLTCSGLFADCDFTGSVKIDLGNTPIIDASEMFYCCNFESNLELCINTSQCAWLRYMFKGCKFPQGFKLDLDTSHVKSFSYMFKDCEFNEDFVLGNSFVIPEDTVTDGMFEGASLPENKYISDFESAYDIVEWLKRRTGRVTAF